MAKLTVEIGTAERQVYNETDVDMVVAPGSEGVLGILPRHAPLLTMLKPGVLRVKKDGQERAYPEGTIRRLVAGSVRPTSPHL